jgi:hypothetical protein
VVSVVLVVSLAAPNSEMEQVHSQNSMRSGAELIGKPPGPRRRPCPAQPPKPSSFLFQNVVCTSPGRGARLGRGLPVPVDDQEVPTNYHAKWKECILEAAERLGRDNQGKDGVVGFLMKVASRYNRGAAIH